MTTQTAALPTSFITRHPTVISCINYAASTEQPAHSAVNFHAAK